MSQSAVTQGEGGPVGIDLHKRARKLLAPGIGIRATARHSNCSTTKVLRIKDSLAH